MEYTCCSEAGLDAPCDDLAGQNPGTGRDNHPPENRLKSFAPQRRNNISHLVYFVCEEEAGYGMLQELQPLYLGLLSYEEVGRPQPLPQAG